MLERRAALSGAARAAASRRILERLEELPEFRDARGVHCFVSLEGEVDTEPIFSACWAAGKETFVPVQFPKLGMLGTEQRRPGDAMVRGPFGVPEPPPHQGRTHELKEVVLGRIDLVLMPGVAFDRRGNRLGYGKGYYDKFLAVFTKKGVNGIDLNVPRRVAMGIGLAFGVQIVKAVPSDPWDLPVKTIVTEQEVIRAD